MPLLYEDEFVIIYLDFHGKGQILPAIYRILVLLLPRENGVFLEICGDDPEVFGRRRASLWGPVKRPCFGCFPFRILGRRACYMAPFALE